MEILNTSLQGTITDLQYGKNSNGEETYLEDLVTITVKSEEKDFVNMYGKKGLKLTFDSTSGRFEMHKGQEVFVNETSYLFSEADREIIENMATIPIYYRSKMIDRLDDAQTLQEVDQVYSWLNTEVSKEPKFSQPIQREVIGRSYSTKYMSETSVPEQDPAQ